MVLDRVALQATLDDHRGIEQIFQQAHSSHSNDLQVSSAVPTSSVQFCHEVVVEMRLHLRGLIIRLPCRCCQHCSALAS